ncbi:MAG: hypothetical protein IJA91_00235, partial [Clostridia bacterium]|nr:hypothetical protein [Clostridia bacterium]
RAGRRKKIAVSQKVFSIFFVPYVPRYSQFSCGFRRASEGRRNTKVNKYSKLLVAAYKCR